MSQLSRRKVDPEILDHLEELFYRIVGKNNTRQEFLNTVSVLLSPTEQLVVVKRIAVFYLHLKKFSERDIAEIVCMSTSTVNKHAQLLYDKRGQVPLKIRLILQDESITKFFDDAFDTFLINPGSIMLIGKLLGKKNSKKVGSNPVVFNCFKCSNI